MTLLNWELTPEGVTILSDTLSLNDTHRPRTFLTKVYPAPHLDAVVTGTGLSEIVTRFYFHVSGQAIANDIDHLMEYAPNILRGIWLEFADKIPEGATTTVYMFGISRQSGKFVGYALRSTADFNAELLPHGIAAKPAPALEELQTVVDIRSFVDLALRQQEHDRALRRQERLGIGGDLWFYSLNKSEDGSLALAMARVMRLPHYDDDHELMLAQLPQNANHPRSLLALACDP